MKINIGIKKINLIFGVCSIIQILLIIMSLIWNNLSYAVFIYIGLWYICLLVVLSVNVFHVSGVLTDYGKLNINKICFLFYTIISILLSSIIYIYINYASNTIKIWDYACYYRMALNFSDLFKIGILDGMKQIIITIWRDEYNLFLLLFTSFPFELSSKTPQAFMNAYFLIYVIPTIIVYCKLAEKLIVKYEIKNIHITYITMCIFTIGFPSLHIAATKGMPDIGGQIFIGLILLLTIDYDFEKIESKRFILLALCSIFLFIFRRWYTFWLVGFYVSYFIFIVVCNIMKKNINMTKKITKNIFIFSVMMMVIITATLSPMLYRIYYSNFANKYNAWNHGGILYELKNQTHLLGIIILILCLCGYLYGMSKIKFRKLAILGSGTGIIALLLFTRIQNMGNHQSLLLVPTYILGMFLFIIYISELKFFKIYFITINLFIFTSFLGSVYNSSEIFNNFIFTSVSLKPEVRTDLEIIQKIISFVENNCSDKEKIYMVLGSSSYNPDIFKNYNLPDRKLDEIIMTEHSVDLTHGFPTEFFHAKYVLITKPIQQGYYSSDQKVITEIDASLHNNSIVSKKFKVKECFIGENGIEFYIYERISDFDEEEAEYFIKLFNEYYPNNKDLFEERINEYVSDSSM